jgi:hypothetical protein
MNYYLVTIETFDGVQQNIIGITDDGVQIGIPVDSLNADYLAYVAWLFEGNTPEEWQPETIEPASEPVIEETPADSTEEPVTEDGN